MIALAQVTGLPVIPCSYYFHSKVRLKSWDRLQIPLPFSRCEAILEKPVSIPQGDVRRRARGPAVSN